VTARAYLWYLDHPRLRRPVRVVAAVQALAVLAVAERHPNDRRSHPRNPQRYATPDGPARKTRVAHYSHHLAGSDAR